MGSHSRVPHKRLVCSSSKCFLHSFSTQRSIPEWSLPAAPCKARFLCTTFLCNTVPFPPCAHCCPTASATTQLPSRGMYLHLLCSPVPADTAQPQLSIPIALPAPGCPLLKCPTCHRAGLQQQQRTTGAAGGQQYRGC